MNKKKYIQLICIFCIAMISALFLYKCLNKEFPEFFKAHDNISSFIIMGLVLITAIYGFFNRNNLSSFAWKFLLWGVIFFVIILGYAFRFELTYVKQRVLSVLIPSYSWVDTAGEIIIARNSDGHFYINALINGTKIKFMIDTGASDVALTTDDAKKLGFDLSKLIYNRTYLTANGASKAARIKLDTVVIGSTFNNVEAHIGTGGLDISLLGMSVLERFKGFKIDKDLLILNY